MAAKFLFTSEPSSQVASAIPSVAAKNLPTSYTTAVSSGAHSSVSRRPTVSNLPEGSVSHSGSARPTYIIRPRIIGIPIERQPGVPATTFLSTSISLLMYLAVMIIIFSIECPFDQDVTYFFSFVLLAFTGSLFTLIINLTAVRYHKFNCLSTSLSLLYSGSAALVVFGLVHTGINGLCKPNNAIKGNLFKSGIASNYFIYILTSLSVLWQLVAYYYYG